MKRIFIVVGEHPNEAAAHAAGRHVAEILRERGVSAQVLKVPINETGWHKALSLLKGRRSDRRINYGTSIDDWIQEHGGRHRNAVYFVFHNTPAEEYFQDVSKRGFTFAF